MHEESHPLGGAQTAQWRKALDQCLKMLAAKK